MTDWQPIATAPKDGTQLLLARVEGGYINRGFWWTEDDSSIGHWFMVGGQWEPTHWMPLPDPPKTALLVAPEEK